MESKEFWLAIRQAILMALDAIEKFIQVKPTTAEIRRIYKGKEKT